MNDSDKSLTLEIIRKCSNRCLHCSTLSSPEATDYIGIDLAKKLCVQAKEYGMHKIILSGGEPCLYPWLFELVDFIKHLGLSLIIYTSGSVINEKNILESIPKTILDKFNESNILRFNLSLHSSRENVHDEFMNMRGSFNKAIEFLENCVKSNLKVEIHTVLSQYNYNAIMDLAKFLEKYKIRTLRVLKLVPQGRARYNYFDLEPSDIQYEAFWASIKRLKESGLSIKIKLGAHLYSLTNNTEYECSLDLDKLTITPNGDATVCPAFKGMINSNSPNVNQILISDMMSSDWRETFKELKTNHKFSCPAQEIYSAKNITHFISQNIIEERK